MRFISIHESRWWHRLRFLVWLGGSVIARIPTVPAVGGRSSMASGANRSPSRELKNGTVLQCKKSSSAVGPVNSTLVCGKPAAGVLHCSPVPTR
jgi:hypothetical protein